MHGFGILFGFWWLIFPLMGFASYGYNMFLSHRRSQQAMDVLKAYAQQGRDPPPEVLAAVTGVHMGQTPPPPPAGAPYNPNPYNQPYGPGYGGWGGPWSGGWGYGRWGWRGPLWSWSRVVTFAAIALGFSVAGHYGGPDSEAIWAFNLVGIIMGALAIGFGVIALIHTLFFRNAPRP